MVLDGGVESVLVGELDRYKKAVQLKDRKIACVGSVEKDGLLLIATDFGGRTIERLVCRGAWKKSKGGQYMMLMEQTNPTHLQEMRWLGRQGMYETGVELDAIVTVFGEIKRLSLSDSGRLRYEVAS